MVQKSLKLFDPVYTKIIFEEVTDNLIEIAMHRHGCCVLQRCIDSAPKSQLDIITNKIIGNAVVLVKDAFGNYVVQYVIALQNTDLNSKLALEFLTRIPELSSQKYSSNVIEKLLEINPSEIQQLIVQEISKPKNLEKMIFDQFANYGNFYLVVQRALNLAPAVLLKSMLSHIKTMLEKLKHSRYGRKICTRLIEDHPELSCK